MAKEWLLNSATKYQVGQVDKDLKLGIWPKISRADVADFMLKQLTNNTYLRQFPTVTY